MLHKPGRVLWTKTLECGDWQSGVTLEPATEFICDGAAVIVFKDVVNPWLVVPLTWGITLVIDIVGPPPLLIGGVTIVPE